MDRVIHIHSVATQRGMHFFFNLPNIDQFSILSQYFLAWPGNVNRAFSLTWPAATQIIPPYCDKRAHSLDKLYSVDSVIGFRNTYPLDSDLSDGQHYPAFDQLGPGANLVIQNVTM